MADACKASTMLHHCSVVDTSILWYFVPMLNPSSERLNYCDFAESFPELAADLADQSRDTLQQLVDNFGVITERIIDEEDTLRLVVPLVPHLIIFGYVNNKARGNQDITDNNQPYKLTPAIFDGDTVKIWPRAGDDYMTIGYCSPSNQVGGYEMVQQIFIPKAVNDLARTSASAVSRATEEHKVTIWDNGRREQMSYLDTLRRLVSILLTVPDKSSTLVTE
jgi:hypothetical protein